MKRVTHGARSAMNHNPEIRIWVENYLKNKVREEKAEMSNEEFEIFWKYHKPEIMHERAVEGFLAYKESRKQV
jgi:arginyl-tRNA--protein-N-Asp/Glu arginylyltransferase